jgi:glycosyltransferase involved in cell wall biosynthesis
MLIRAFRPISERSPHSLFIAGGRGWLAEGITAEIDRQGLGDRARLVGFVDDADLPALYSTADLLAFPSLYEGFGLPLLEAMACGTPVVTSNASSLPEVVSSPAGEAAVMLSPHDETAWTAAMLRLLGDAEERRRLSVAGLARSREFSWRKAARQLAELYALLLSAQRR